VKKITLAALNTFDEIGYSLYWIRVFRDRSWL